MIAVLRRLFGVLPILVGLVCLFWPAAGIWKLEIVDYGTEYRERVAYANQVAAKRAKKSGKPLVVHETTAQGLDAYVGKETRFSIRKVKGPAWEELFEMTSRKKRYLYLPADAPPLNSLDRTDDRDFFDLQLPDRYPKFLTANLVSITSPYLGPEATWEMTHPHTWLAVWLIPLGLVVYILLPRPKKAPGCFRYHLIRSQIGIDALAIFLGGVFLVLPLFIVIQFAGESHPFSMDGGKAIVTLVFWFIALISLTSLAISTWYEKLHFQIAQTGIRKTNLLRSEEFPFDQMTGLTRRAWSPPAWFKRLSWLMLAFNPGLAGPMILGSMNQAPFVIVLNEDGRELSIMTKHLIGWSELEKTLLDSGLEYAEDID